ncbi:uncharacterized protein LOC144568705 [Carex rostrata]
MVQPWFERAVESSRQTVTNRGMCVRDLVIEGTGTWNAELLIQIFGHQVCLQILTNIQPPRDGAGEDRLVFIDSSTGAFSVKQAYKNITSPRHNMQSSKVWKLVWRKGSILPRIRVFIWKLLHGALPLAKNLASRTSRGDPTCVVCQHDDEDVLHMLFMCPFARACWLRGPLALRTDRLSCDLPSIFTWIFDHSSEETWTDMANTAWAVWRCRNEKVYGGKVPTFERFQQILNLISREARIVAVAHLKKGARVEEEGAQVSSSLKVYRCMVDGSWKPPWRGGIGFVVEEDGVLKGYRAAPCTVCCPLQAEVVALKEAILFVKGLGLQSCSFFTDNQILAQTSMAQQPPLDADWRAYKEIQEIWGLLKENDFECLHIGRSHNGLADYLAKGGSTLDEGYTGYSYPAFNF